MLNFGQRICRVLSKVLLHHTVHTTALFPQLRTSAVLSGKGFVTSSSIKMAPSKHLTCPGADRLRGTERNIWVEYVALATEYNAVNLGQGFPDFHAPDYVRKALSDGVMGDNPLNNQYTRGFGYPPLVNILAKVFSRLHAHPIDPMKEVLVTAGAYESLFCAFQGLVNPGDEVIIIEPYFDCYEAMTKVAGGIGVYIPLRPNKSASDVSELSSVDWVLDPAELEAAFSDKTKLLIINNPNNPLGKVYSKSELEMVAGLCKKHDVIVVSDEVYEWLTYDGHEHLRIATLPDMWERTLTVSSAGKTFSVTGWKLGWTVGPQHLLRHLQTVHQNCVYTCPTIIQYAVAKGMELEATRLGHYECYFNELPRDLQPKRDMMARFLAEVGMVPTIPEGGYFMVADYSKLDVPYDKTSEETKDGQFVKWMTREKRLAAIPPSAFYSPGHKHLAQNLVRFCFIKEDATLKKAENIMKQWAATLSK